MRTNRKTQAIGYVRVSVDDADKISPDVQSTAIEEYAKRKGWECEIVVERRRSAGEGKRRPKFELIREQIDNGEIGALIVYRLDRATRSVIDFGDLWRDLSDAGVEFVSVSESFDTSTPMGKAMLQISVVFAELERSTIVERTKAVHRYRRAHQMAPTGLPSYGYRKSGSTLVIEESEAVWVRRIVEWLLDGVSLRRVARRLDEAGAPPFPKERRRREKAIEKAEKDGIEPPPFGPPKFGWTAVRLIAQSPTIAGLRDDPDTGGYSPGNWEPIINPDTWYRLGRVLSNPERRTSTNRTPSLLSGIVLCARCGARMRPHYPRGKQRYRCVRSDQYPDACQGMSIEGAGLEHYVEAELLSYVEGVKLPAASVDRGGDDVAELREALDDLAAGYGAGELSLSEWQAARLPLNERIAAAESMQARERSAAVTAMLTDTDLRTRWEADEFTIEAKRAMLRQAFDAVKVSPANGRLREIASRVTIVPAA